MRWQLWTAVALHRLLFFLSFVLPWSAKKESGVEPPHSKVTHGFPFAHFEKWRCLISLLLRNIWVLVHATLLADRDDIHPEPCLEKLRYADLLEWLNDYIKALLAVSIGFGIDC